MDTNIFSMLNSQVYLFFVFNANVYGYYVKIMFFLI